MDVEVIDLVRRAWWKIWPRLGCVGGPRPVDAVGSHVFVDAFDWCWVAFEETAPIFGVRREDLVLIAIDERLEDTLDVRANRSHISRALLSFSRESDREYQRHYEKCSHGRPPFTIDFVPCVPFLWQEQIRERRVW